MTPLRIHDSFLFLYLRGPPPFPPPVGPPLFPPPVGPPPRCLISPPGRLISPPGRFICLSGRLISMLRRLSPPRCPAFRSNFPLSIPLNDVSGLGARCILSRPG